MKITRHLVIGLNNYIVYDKIIYFFFCSQKLLTFNPHRRISASDALRHKYFKDCDIDSVRTTSSLSPTSTSESDSTDGRSDTPVSK